MDKEYLENLILVVDDNILGSKDIQKIKNFYKQFRLRLINHLDLDLEDTSQSEGG